MKAVASLLVLSSMMFAASATAAGHGDDKAHAEKPVASSHQGHADHSKMAGMNHGPVDHVAMAKAEFAKLDANKNGAIETAEVDKANPLGAHFAMLDANKDGRLSKAEFDKHHGL